MNKMRNERFLSKMLPLLERLQSEFFDPKEQPHNACVYCSLNCGQGDRHDFDCILSIAHILMTKVEEINEDTSFNTDFRLVLRPDEEIVDIKNSHKVRTIINYLKDDIYKLIPLDLQDPDNEGIICECNLIGNESSHLADCPYQEIAGILSELFNPSI